MNALPKNPIMQQCEMIMDVMSHFKLSDQDKKKDSTPEEFREIEKIITENENILDSTSKSSDFYAARNELENIEKVLWLYYDRVGCTLEDCKERICPSCGGSGYAENLNPNSNYCSECKGSGIL